MPTNVASGTQTAVIGTEHVLVNADSSNKNYVLSVDTRLMQNGDVVEFRIKTKVLSTSTLGVAYYAVYAQTQAHPVKYSVPVPATAVQTITCTLKQTEGTGRAYDWSLDSVT
jgi:DNA-directed RNA polymerase subunit E'/Rpb7